MVQVVLGLVPLNKISGSSFMDKKIKIIIERKDSTKGDQCSLKKIIH